MNVARSGTPSCLCSTPSALGSSRLVSASIGNGSSCRSGCWRAPGEVHEVGVGADAEHLRVAVGEVALARPNSAISVGQTKVKSIGQKKTTFHLPG